MNVPSNTAPRIELTTLGSLRVERDGEEIRELVSQPVRCALFVYLAVERSATRDQLAALFWPEREPARARHSLSQALYELRRRIGGEWLLTTPDRVEVAPSVTVDAVEFASAVDAGDDERALRRYGGAFLDGFHLADTTEFESWVVRRRSMLSRLHRDICRRVGDARRAQGDVEGALEAARRWIEMDPLEDEAHHQTIELLAQAGRRSDALRHYEEYRQLIARELDVEPLDATKELVARIQRQEQQDTPAALDEPGADPRSEPPGDSLLGEPHVLRQDPPSDLPQAPPVPLTTGLSPRRVAGAVLLAVLAATLLFWGAARRPPADRSENRGASLDPLGIAVLPFLNLSADPEKEYFSDGITEDLLTSLSRIRDLRVISRTSVMRYKRADIGIVEIARQLNVRYILEGSVRREENQVRISAQLIDAATDAHLWADTYDRELTGVFQVQSEIAQRIADALVQQLSPDDRARIAAGGTRSLSAYDLVLRGREYLNRPGDADLRKYSPAINFFNRALDADPGYARAYVGLSEAFLRNAGLPETTRAESALSYAKQAVQADPALADAAAALGASYALANRRDLADQEFRRALALDRNHADAMAGLARLSALAGQLDEAIRWQRRAVNVDPSSAARLLNLGEYLFDLGALAGAERAFASAAEFAPDFPEPGFLLAQVHLLRGEPERADARMQALLAPASDHPATQILTARYQAQRSRYDAAEEHLSRSPKLGAVTVIQAHIARRLGQEARVRELLQGSERVLLEFEKKGRSVPPRLQLYTRALLGDVDGALDTLAKHWRTGLRTSSPDPPEIGVYWIDAEPFVESLRGDPRFQALLREIRAELDVMRLRLNE